MFGGYEIDVNTNGMPQKVATGFAELNEQVGAEYRFIAYLGKQQVNGINHAVLAEQTLIVGKDIVNAVIIIFNESKEGFITVAAIELIVEQGAPMGGILTNVTTDIPEEAMAAFNSTFEGFVGSKVEPFALLGTQVTNGINYIFAAVMTPVVEDPKATLKLVIVNDRTGQVAFVDLLNSKADALSLGYAFTWLVQTNTSLGKPLGEWP